MSFLQAEKGLVVDANQEMSDVQLKNTSNIGGDDEDPGVTPGSTITDQQDMRRLYVPRCRSSDYQ